jgi:cell division transport system ATP-binding protein
MVQLIDVTKTYDDNGTKGIDHVSFDINDGEFVFVIGTSGSGKTTFMRLLLREVELTGGELYVNGIDLGTLQHKDIPYYRRHLGVVFQDFKLLPNKTVYENVAFAMQVVGATYREIRRTVPAIITMVGLQKKAKAYPSQLSGGEKQRTALARAIVNRPSILLADEPTGNLDPDTAWSIMELLEDINAMGTTVIVATHAKEIVNQMQKRVIALKNGVLVSDVEIGGYNEDV